jgi:hypothetical protein
VFGEKNILKNSENVVTITRVGNSSNLQQYFMTTFTPNGSLACKNVSTWKGTLGIAIVIVRSLVRFHKRCEKHDHK